MNIKNIGNEVVFIGEIAILPGEDATVANSTAQSPIVEVLAKNGKVLLTKDKDAKVPAKKSVEAPKEVADKNATSAKKPKKSTAKSK